MAPIIASRFGTLEPIRNAIKKDLQQIEEICPEIAHSVVKFYAAKKPAKPDKRGIPKLSSTFVKNTSTTVAIKAIEKMT